VAVPTVDSAVDMVVAMEDARLVKLSLEQD
jgi:hypothetical protein